MNHYKIPISLGALGLVIMLLLACPTTHSVAAEEKEAAAIATVSVLPTISVALQNRVAINVIPKASGSFAASTAKLTVATNSRNGYSLYMSTGNNTQDLQNSDTTITETIKSMAASATEDSFVRNTWGYSLDKGNDKTYHPLPTTDSGAIDQTNTSSAQNEYDLTFGVSVDTNLPAGQYSNSVIVSAVANPIEVNSLAGLTYMQHMNSEICANTAEGTTKQLIDTRDGNSYWVAKMKDGNCWMTQNLALDITEKGLSAMDTDIEYDWNSRSVHPPKNTISEYSGEDFFTTSYNLGKYVYATPMVAKRCGGSSFAGCVGNGYVDVSSEAWTPTFTAQNGTYTYADGTTYEGVVAVNEATKEYDAHYLIGNYYQYGAATAGMGAFVNKETTIADSICPKGWELPSASSSLGFDTSGSFAYLLRQYDLATSSTAGIISNNNYNLTLSPFYFVRTGAFNGYLAQYGDAGLSIGYWSSTSLSNLIAMFAYSSNASSFKPAYNGATNHNQAYAFSIRCIAHQLHNS